MPASTFQFNDLIIFMLYFSELAIANLCFASGLSKKTPFLKRLMCCFLLFALISSLMTLFLSWAQIPKTLFPSLCIYTLLTAMTFLTVFLCFSGPVWDRLFCCLCGLICQMAVKKGAILVRVIAELCNFRGNLLAKGQPLYYVIYYTILIITYVLVYRNFRILFSSHQPLLFNGKIFITFVGSNLIFLLFNVIEAALMHSSPMYYILVLVCEIFYCITLLCMQFFLFEMTQAQIESTRLKEMWKKDRQQYELAKENIDIINIKCHDIRHQIHNAQLSGKLSDEFISELEQSISIYDSSIKTGNEILDVILTDKSLRCQAEHIQLTCIVDGRKCSFLESSDLISLFSNALENAMEYVSTLPNPEKRYINLLVRQKSQILTIQIENYYEGSLVMQDGLPVTSKADTAHHGYGIKSMRHIAEKYGGSLDLSVGEGIFKLNILFPR